MRIVLVRLVSSLSRQRSSRCFSFVVSCFLEVYNSGNQVRRPNCIVSDRIRLRRVWPPDGASVGLVGWRTWDLLRGY